MNRLATGRWVEVEGEVWEITSKALEPHATLGEATIVQLRNCDGDTAQATVDELAGAATYPPFGTPRISAEAKPDPAPFLCVVAIAAMLLAVGLIAVCCR